MAMIAQAFGGARAVRTGTQTAPKKTTYRKKKESADKKRRRRTRREKYGPEPETVAPVQTVGSALPESARVTGPAMEWMKRTEAETARLQGLADYYQQKQAGAAQSLKNYTSLGAPGGVGYAAIEKPLVEKAQKPSQRSEPNEVTLRSTSLGAPGGVGHALMDAEAILAEQERLKAGPRSTQHVMSYSSLGAPGGVGEALYDTLPKAAPSMPAWLTGNRPPREGARPYPGVTERGGIGSGYDQVKEEEARREAMDEIADPYKDIAMKAVKQEYIDRLKARLLQERLSNYYDVLDEGEGQVATEPYDYTPTYYGGGGGGGGYSPARRFWMKLSRWVF